MQNQPSSDASQAETAVSASPAKSAEAAPAKAAPKAQRKPVFKLPATSAAPKTAVPAKKAAVEKSKAAAKPVSKVAAKPQPKAAAKPLSKVKAAKPVAEKTAKEKKVKLVRDSITIPKNEYEVLGELKLRAAKLGISVKKTELIRAGIKALAAMSDTHLKAATGAVPSLKTGRPSKSE